MTSNVTAPIADPESRETGRQPVRSVCFVSETGRRERPVLDGSVRYRCFHMAQELAGRGIHASVVAAADFHAAPHASYDAYVFHRPNVARQNFARSIDTLRRAGRRMAADYDDLIFGDADVALESSAARNGTLDEQGAIRAFAVNLEALRHFESVTTSTAPLAERARAEHPAANVAVTPNFLPAALVDMHRTIGTPTRPRPATRIGYFAGTKSHDHDLPIVQEVLHRVLSERPDMQLLILGPVKVPFGLASLPNVLVTDVVDYAHLPFAMTRCSTVIAPLETTRFNDCKSRVKFLESTLAGCRLVATPIPDMAELGDLLTTARGPDDWYEALSAPLKGETLSAARERALSSLDPNPSVETLLAMLEDR